ncbi:hypothetical protein IEQ34_014836 [Dendrobium chrysotoxum]|uniref:Uncharacterized protein n=2 Tax=Dendrobium chrysotoxum TaxID=161865 RepID=A0AAV7G4W7_DENCH|nr:hypothetical protein IEQ34_014836 [Dendrobium chrysotoxum]
MGRAPCCSKVGLHRGPWTSREDALLTSYIKNHGTGNWKSLPKRAGLLRCGKSCRLRWMNYIRPDIKRGNISPEEEDLIIRLHSLLGNRWSLIAGRLPGRTDNEIKNYWNGHLSKKLKNQGLLIKEAVTKRLTPRDHNSKKKKNNNNINNNEAKCINIENVKMNKIYAPKPTRIYTTYRNYVTSAVTESNEETEGTNGRLDSGDESSSGNYQEILSSSDNGEEANLLDVNHYLGSDLDLVNCDFFLQDHEVLDRVYQEYLQLLNVETDKEN